MKKFLFLFCAAFGLHTIAAQTVDTTAQPTQVWGYTMPENSKPLFSYWRLGLHAGGIIPTSGVIRQYPSANLRLELGLGSRASVMADLKTSSVGLSAQYLLSSKHRVQPYLGVGWNYGVGNLDSLSSSFTRQNGRGDIRNTLVAQNFATAKIGVNYLIRRRLIWQTEVGFLQPIGGTDATPASAVTWQTGIAYQFGKKK